MSTQSLLLLVNASFFLCILGITGGIVLYNWGTSINIKYPKLKGVFVVVANGLIIYLVSIPMSIKLTQKIFLEKEYSGIVIEKTIEKHNHNIPYIYIRDFQTQERMGVSFKRKTYNQIAIGDTLSKQLNTDFIEIINKSKVLNISKEQLFGS